MEIQNLKTESNESSGSFQFEEVEFEPSIFKDPDLKKFVQKWGLDDTSYIKRFRFDEFMTKEQESIFFRDLFTSRQAQKSIPVAVGRNSWAPIASLQSVSVRQLACDVTNMEFFEKIKEMSDPPVVRHNGALTHCLDEFIDGVAASDELRKMLLIEDSDHYEEFSESERREFIFHMFRRVAVGGGLCQFEDEITPYLDCTRSLYRDLIEVQKNASTKKIEATSWVYQIESIDANLPLFPQGIEREQRASQEHSFCYAVVGPLSRIVTVWYLAHIPLF